MQLVEGHPVNAGCPFCFPPIVSAKLKPWSLRAIGLEMALTFERLGVLIAT